MHKVILRVLIREVFNIDKTLMITLRVLVNTNIAAERIALDSRCQILVIFDRVLPKI